MTTLYRHDGRMGVEGVETQGSNTTVTRYGLGARGVDLIERQTLSPGGGQGGGTTVTAFPIYDAHGNNVASLTRNGTSFSIGDRRTYDAWGVVRAQQSSGDPKLRYCASLGHKVDDESGLIYMRARYYEPNSGRFVSEDTAMHGQNWFVYCSNNPVNLADSTGENGEGWFGLGANLAALGVLLSFLSVGLMLDKIIAPLTGLVMSATAAAAAFGAVFCFTMGFLGFDLNTHDKAMSSAMAGVAATIATGAFKALLSGVDSAIKELGSLGKFAGGLGTTAGCLCAAQLCAVTAALIAIDL